MRTPPEISALAKTLRETRLPKPIIRIGEISVKLTPAKIGLLQYNAEPFELLKGSHDYQAEIGGCPVELSLQIYLNTANHYRLFAYVRRKAATPGMMFSLNFTTAKDLKGIIGLEQRIQFTEGRSMESEGGRSIRQAKKRILADILLRCGIGVTDASEVSLGTYCAKRRTFLDTMPETFLSQFLAVALLKGHFQGNKGYQFACLPRFDDSFLWKWDSADEVRKALTPNKRGGRGERTIPLGLRFRVLERDEGRCVICGMGPRDGVILHIDHKTPFSLGGLSVLSNLQTLCEECNLGKGNRSTRSFLRE